MKKDIIENAISDIDDKFINEASEYSYESKGIASPLSKKKKKIKLILVAACLLLTLILGSGAVVFAQDTKEYNDALDFFKENGLSVSGLSRYEIKAVYRDIKTESFSYKKTAEVIENSILGYEIKDEVPPENVNLLWMNSSYASSWVDSDYFLGLNDPNILMKSANAYAYVLGCFSPNFRDYRDNDYLYHLKRIESESGIGISVECFHKGKAWEKKYDEDVFSGAFHSSMGTVVKGRYKGANNDFIQVIDDEGNVLFNRNVIHDGKYEYIDVILDNKDETLSVFSRIDFKKLYFAKIDKDGHEICSSIIETGNDAIVKAVKVSDGYIVEIGKSDDLKLLKLDQNGKYSDTITYEDKDMNFSFVGIAEYEGKIYLSGYMYPKGNSEIEKVIKYVYDTYEDDTNNVDSADLTEKLRENYTAVLLLCDRESGDLEKFYSVKGAFGSRLSVNDSNLLVWEVGKIFKSFFYPAMNAFTIAGATKTYSYSFDQNGNLLESNVIGEEAFRR